MLQQSRHETGSWEARGTGKRQRPPQCRDRVGSSSQAGDRTQTPISGCKMRPQAPSSPVSWSPNHRTGYFPVHMPSPHPRNFVFFNTDSLLTLLPLPPGWARLEEENAQFGARGGLEKHLCFPFWPLRKQHAHVQMLQPTSWVLFINSCLAGFMPSGEHSGEEEIFQHLFYLLHNKDAP